MIGFSKRERGTGNGERTAYRQPTADARPRARSERTDGSWGTLSRSPFPVPRSPRASRATGFTLLEMLAVIVLIGVIATIVVRSVSGSVDKGKYGAGKAQLTELSQSIENYALDNGSPPKQLESLVTKPANAPNWQGPYAKASLLKDPWGHGFGYQYPGQHGSFDLVFYGQDGQPGGDGYSKDVGSWQ